MAEIKRDITLDRYAILDDLARAGYDLDNANDFLKGKNYPEMDSQERRYFRTIQTLSYTPHNIKEIFSGIPTFLGWLQQRGIPGIARRVPTYLQGGVQFTQGKEDPEVKEQISKDVERFQRNTPRIWDALFGNLGLDWERVHNTLKGQEGGISLNASGQAIRTHPVDTVLLLAPLARPIGELAGATSIGQDIASANEFNQLLNRSLAEAFTSTSKLDKMSRDFARNFHGLSPNDKVAVTEAITLTGARDLGNSKLTKREFISIGFLFIMKMGNIQMRFLRFMERNNY